MCQHAFPIKLSHFLCLAPVLFSEPGGPFCTPFYTEHTSGQSSTVAGAPPSPENTLVSTYDLQRSQKAHWSTMRCAFYSWKPRGFHQLEGRSVWAGVIVATLHGQSVPQKPSPSSLVWCPSLDLRGLTAGICISLDWDLEIPPSSVHIALWGHGAWTRLREHSTPGEGHPGCLLPWLPPTPRLRTSSHMAPYGLGWNVLERFALLNHEV